MLFLGISTRLNISIHKEMQLTLFFIDLLMFEVFLIFVRFFQKSRFQVPAPPHPSVSFIVASNNSCLPDYSPRGIKWTLMCTES
jgi:ACR3 family arsenite efflux pump ArsB